ncbi:MAG: mitochondrial fission ELM1 family protein [Rhizomicrobium sp.]
MRERISSCWVVTDGKTGMESQCVGLAEALGIPPDIKRIRMREPWRSLSPWLQIGLSRAFENNADVSPPWPDLLIATGRLSVPASLYVRNESGRRGRRTFTVQIQDPVISPDNFDLVIAPLHDELQGDNVISTIGALHRIEPGRLAREAQILTQRIGPLPRPYVGVLIGGANASYAFGEDEAIKLASDLRTLAREMPASLLVTPSRRTGDKNMALLKTKLGDARAFVWDGNGDNPYFGFLGLADDLIVTADSVNMISEACASGRRVHVYDLPGGSKKSFRFRRALIVRGLVRDFAIPLTRYEATPLNEMQDVVAAIRQRWEAA